MISVSVTKQRELYSATLLLVTSYMAALENKPNNSNRVQYTLVDEVSSWCEKNLRAGWEFRAQEYPSIVEHKNGHSTKVVSYGYFVDFDDDDTDAIYFKLRWING